MSSTVRLWGLLARDAPRGVLFRRGPSKQVQLILWHTDRDVFVPGQWFKGRIYERRCDLSPSGQRLIYFAAKFKGPYHSWTAVSRPPFLTAVALWPKGNTWGGGGLFVAEDNILLNHAATESASGDDPPTDIVVRPLGPRAGMGEDEPILARRLARDGWVHVQAGAHVQAGRMKRGESRHRLGWHYDPPDVWERQHPYGRPWRLRMSTLGISERGGPWYVTEYAAVNNDGAHAEVLLGRTDWADWDHRGDLVFATGGQLSRLSIGTGGGLASSPAKLLADFSGRTFSEVAPPQEARQWWSTLPE